jgi:RHS repeat-associated protein
MKRFFITSYLKIILCVLCVQIINVDLFPQTPFGGTVRSIPGLIQVEDFDLGGEGVAYHDLDVLNQGGAYRKNEAVDIESLDGGYAIGWFNTGEWLKYTVDVTSGIYNVKIRVVTPNSNSQLKLYLDNQLVNTLKVPYTGNWDVSWTTFTIPNITIGGGTGKILKIECANDPFDINWIEFVRAIPTAPTALTDNIVSGTQVNLSWTDNSSDEDGFKIEQKIGTGSFAEIATLGANITTYSNTGLTAGTNYTYRIRAYNTGGNSAYTNEITVTPPTVPVAPTLLTANAVSGSQIDLSWTDNSNDESGFKIEQKTGTGSFAEIATLGANITTYSNTGLTAGTNYTYRIRAYNTGGNSAYSNEITVTPPTVPVAPTLLTANAVSGSQIDLSWTDNSSNESGFKIEQKIGSNSFIQIATVGPNVITYNNTGLNEGTTYTYRVSAYNVAGTSVYTSEVQVTIPYTISLPMDNIAAYFPFCGVANDVSINHKNGTLQNVTLTADRLGKANSACSFNGSSGIITLPKTVLSNSNSFAISFWMNPSGIHATADNYQYVVDLRGQYFVSIVYSQPNVANNPGSLRFSTMDASSNRMVINSKANSVPLNQWSHIIATYNNNLMELYINGVKVGSASAMPPGALGYNPYNSLGKHVDPKLNDSWFYGGLDEVIFYNRGLTPGEVQALYVRGLNTSEIAEIFNSPLPSAPNLLSAKVASVNQINLSWTDNSSNEDGFKIERKTADGTFTEIATVGANVTTYNNTGLTTDTKYTYRVTAYNLSGNSAYSNEIAATPPSIPITPTLLTAKAVSGSQVDLSWTDNANNESGFKIEQKIGTGGFSAIATVGANSNSYSITGLTPGTSYTYRIKAYNDGGNSLYSNEAIISPPTAPLLPTSLTVVVVSGTQVDLTWTDNSSNEDGFKIEQKTGNGNFAEITTVDANTSTFSIPGLVAGESYTFRVKAYNVGGSSTYSNEAVVTIPVAPLPPVNLTAAAISGTQANLTWIDKADNEDGFSIEQKIGTSNYKEIAIVGPNVVTYSSAGLTPGTSYTYRIRSFNVGGKSSYSNDVVVTPPVVPLPPVGLSATAISGTQVNLTWIDQADNEDGFKIEQRTGTDFTEIATVGPNEFTYSNTGLTAGTSYTYRVRAYNIGGSSPYSDVLVVTTPTVPLSPTSLLAKAISGTQVDLTWTDNANNEVGFKIEQKTGTGDFTEIAAVGANAVTYSNTGLTTGTSYTYRVTAYNAEGNSSYSNEVIGTPPFVPSDPTSLTATAISGTRVDLTWTDNANNEDGFYIERRVDGGEYVRIKTIGPDITNFSDNEAPEGAWCIYRVFAFNVTGVSNNYASIQVYTPPLAPTDLTARLLTSTQIVLSWTDNSSRESNYLIERKTENGSYSFISSVNSNIHGYTDNVTKGVKYTYRVQAFTSSARSSYSNEVEQFAVVSQTNTLIDAKSYTSSAGATNVTTGVSLDRNGELIYGIDITNVNSIDIYYSSNEPGELSITKPWGTVYGTLKFKPTLGAVVKASVDLVNVPSYLSGLSLNGNTGNIIIQSFKLYYADKGPFKINTIPGTIQMEDFDKGLPGIAYKDDISAPNSYRSEPVDIVGLPLPDFYFIDNFIPGDWFTYTVNVAKSGYYNLQVNALSYGADGSISVQSLPQEYSTPVVVNNLGSGIWKRTCSNSSINLTAGTNKILVKCISGIIAIDKIKFTDPEVPDLIGNVTGSFDLNKRACVLNWTNESCDYQITKIELYKRKKVNGESFQLLATLNNDALTYTDNSVFSPGGEYEYKLMVYMSGYQQAILVPLVVPNYTNPALINAKDFTSQYGCTVQDDETVLIPNHSYVEYNNILLDDLSMLVLNFAAISEDNSDSYLLVTFDDDPFAEVLKYLNTGSLSSFIERKLGLKGITGVHKIRITCGAINGIVLKSISFDKTTLTYPFKLRTLPAVIKAIDFDYGADGYAYHSSSQSTMWPYRNASGRFMNYNLDPFQQGEWFKYSIGKTGGQYELSLEVALNTNTYGDSGKISLYNNDLFLGSFIYKFGTGYLTCRSRIVNIPSDVENVLKVVCDYGSFSFDNITFSPAQVPANGIGLEPISNTNPTMHWSHENCNESGYRVMRRLQGTSTFATIATLPENTFDFDDTTLVAPSTTYEYQVEAFNEIGTSAPSNTVSITTQPSRSLLNGLGVLEYNASKGVKYGLMSDVFVHYFTGSGWIRYHNLDFGAHTWWINVNYNATEDMAGSVFEFRLDSPSGMLLATMTAENTLGASTWFRAKFPSAVSGNHHLYIIQKSNLKVNLFNTLRFSQNLDGQESYYSPPFSTNIIMEAELYDYGGEGVAYHDLSPMIKDPYRGGEAVDTKISNDEAGSTCIYSFEEGEWLEYTQSIPANTYNLYLRVSCPYNGRQMKVYSNDVLLATVPIPNTGSFDKWTTVKVPGIELTETGEKVFRFENVGGDFYFNWYSICEPNKTPWTFNYKYKLLSASSIQFDWTIKQTNETGFRVERKIEGGEYAVLGTFPATDRKFIDTGLTPGTKYYYRVIVTNPSGDAYTVNIDVTAQDPNHTLNLVLNSVNQKVELLWTEPVSRSSNFLIERKPEGGTYKPIADAYEPKFTDQPATNCRYYYRVSYMNYMGYTYSEEGSVYFCGKNCINFPTLLTSEETSSGVVLSWSDNSDNEAGFRIERRTGYTDFEPIALVGANVSTYTNHTRPGTYTYRVRAYNADGYTDYTNEQTVTIAISLAEYTSSTQMNSVETITYDEFNNVTSQAIVYSDLLGRGVQTQSRNVTQDKVMVSQTIYDGMGRAAITTLPASIDQQNLDYVADFVTNPSGNEFNYANFDKVDANGLRIDPDAISGKLTEYYSASNTDEPYTPTSAYPYTQAEYSKLNPGVARKSAIAGENHRLGSGNETQTYTMAVPEKELTYFVTGVFDGLTDVALETKGATKTIGIDADDNTSVVYTSAGGKQICACYADASAPPQNVIATFAEEENSYCDVHINVASSVTLSAGTCKVFNLANDSKLGEYSGSISLNPGVYRFQYIGTPAAATTLTYKVYYKGHSFNFYDNAGRSIFSLSPKSYSEWKDSKNTDRSYSNMKNYASYNEYNSLGWLLSTSSPDEGITTYRYANDGRIRFSQNAQQKVKGKFSYTNYDDANRPEESGECIGSFANENVATNIKADATHVISQWIRTTYDYPADDKYYSFFGLQNYTLGKVSKTSTINDSTYYSYTYDGKVEWVVQDIKGLGEKTIEYWYDDISGRLTKTLYQRGKDDEFTHDYIYDADGRLEYVYTKDSKDAKEKLQAHYLYYAHGPLKRVELAGNLQGIDYVYTINGWLKSINHPDQVANDPGGDSYDGYHSSFKQDVFGMSLDYYSGDYVRTGTNITSITSAPKYNGSITASRWNTSGQAAAYSQWAYQYIYNNRGFLSQAIFGTIAGGNTIAPTNAYNEIITGYDENGNITGLNRAASYCTIDQLTYHYTAGLPNRLSYVSDASTQTSFTTDIKNQSSDNYTYNAIGQMTGNVLDKQYFTYDVYGHVTEIYSDALHTPANNVAKYTYNDKGFRIKKEAAGKTTWYVRDATGQILATYEGVTPKLSEISLYGSSRIGQAQANETTGVIEKYAYELTDHLGNVRATISANASGGLDVLSYADYYPFGMEIPGRSYINGKAYRFGYQGQYAEKDESGYNHFEARDYDSRIGRWLIPDPAGQYHNPYLGMGNNPVKRVDSNGKKDGDPPPTGIIDLFSNLWTSFVSQFSSTGKDELYQNYANGDPVAIKEVQNRELANTIATTEITPYITVSLGKQSSEGSLLSGWGSLTFTRKGTFLSTGGDMTFGSPGLLTRISSVSLSFGAFIGPSQGIEGMSVGGGAGSFLGVNGSRSLNNDFSWSNTFSVGLSVSDSPAYVSGNAGYTWKLPAFGTLILH